jgi:hypothetical protein
VQWLAVIVLGMFAVPAAAQVYTPDLARARAAYNDRRFDEAIVAATTARKIPEVEDAAVVVLARALLERYRDRADPSDLSAAREALGTVRGDTLSERDRLELLLAFGEALFLEDDFGAAAEMLETGLTRAAGVDEALLESMLEWWGSAVERQASGLAPDFRKARFSHLAARMQEELSRVPSSAAASYWNVVGLRGAGESLRAWDAAVAAWVRARLVGERSASLRADLDQLVLTGVIPDRVAHIVQDQRAASESQLKAEWALVKERWK